jgi:8-oxo-dGTP pyrophosphatase MutT (NUDIX family)
VKLVVDYQGRVPLLKNERDEWELPGGKLEVGESPEHSVCREAAEELRLAAAMTRGRYSAMLGAGGRRMVLCCRSAR